MIPITEVADGIFKIGPLDTRNNGATPWTAPFLVVGKERAATLEPGEKGQADELLQAIGGRGDPELKIDLNRIAYLIPTHIHLHHIAGANILLERCPNAKVACHQRGAPHLAEPTRLNESTLQVWGQDSGCPQIAPIPENRIIALAGGEVLDLGGRELEIIETVGHAPHHIAVFDRLTKTLFTGDSAGAFHLGPGGRRARPDILPPLFDVDRAVDSVRRMRALKARRIFVFGWNAASYTPNQTLRWAEKDYRAVEKICLEGMQKKLPAVKIAQKVEEYYDSVGRIQGHGEDESVPREQRSRGPIGMYAYIKRKYPDLELPK
ncbi:MAG: MBL fold metallo-hydrolase [Chloroflexi bacterium]|nr:MBL fold metallo-hydrolase [Chloroflexota bacterium]